jgi:DNA-binding MarR family transcriptional regulator
VKVAPRFDTYAAATKEWTFRELRRDLAEYVESEDETGVKECVDHIRQLVVLAVTERSLPNISKLRAQIHRLAATARKATSSGADILVDAEREFASFDELLDVAGAVAHVRATKARQQHESTALADRILRALQSGPARTRDIAELCNCDPTQASRILSALRNSGAVVVVPAPVGQSDRRARWHALAEERVAA